MTMTVFVLSKFNYSILYKEFFGDDWLQTCRYKSIVQSFEAYLKNLHLPENKK